MQPINYEKIARALVLLSEHGTKNACLTSNDQVLKMALSLTKHREGVANELRKLGFAIGHPDFYVGTGPDGFYFLIPERRKCKALFPSIAECLTLPFDQLTQFLEMSRAAEESVSAGLQPAK